MIVPLKLDWEPYYALDEQESVCVGDFVAVPFAGRRYIGAVCACDVSLPEGMNPATVREIYSIHSEIPPLAESQIEFFRQVARYYMCTVGEVLKMACPSSRSTYCASRKKILTFDRSSSPMMPALSHAASAPIVLNSTLDVEEMISRCGNSLTRGNVLWIVPDSETLKSLENRLRDRFHDKLIVYSQEITPSKRHALEMSIRDGSNHLILGTRGALFLPFYSLDLILVQQEHSSSYKQSGIAPRYNARDAAIMLSGIHGAGILLQSPTPSLESIYNCRQKKYVLSDECSLAMERLKGVEIEIVDTRAELRKNGMAGDIPKILLPGFRSRDTEVNIAFVKPRKALFPKTEELYCQLQTVFGKECFYSDDAVLKPVPSCTQTLCVFGMDSLLTKYDFRADERALQELYMMIEPCLGNLRRLVVMTRQASHAIFAKLFDFEALLEERKSLSLPPFTRIVDIHMRSDDGGKHDQMHEFLAQFVPSFSKSSYPIEDGWRVVLPKDKSLISKKQELNSTIIQAERKFKCYGAVYFDVDP